jgi:hypothetical protein
MERDEIHLGSGRVVHWDLDRVDLHSPLAESLDWLKEDLALIEFPNDVIVDVGWYPEFSLAGRFRVHVVRGHDWAQPAASASARTRRGLERALSRAIGVAESM